MIPQQINGGIFVMLPLIHINENDVNEAKQVYEIAIDWDSADGLGKDSAEHFQRLIEGAAFLLIKFGHAGMVPLIHAIEPAQSIVEMR